MPVVDCLMCSLNLYFNLNRFGLYITGYTCGISVGRCYYACIYWYYGVGYVKCKSWFWYGMRFLVWYCEIYSLAYISWAYNKLMQTMFQGWLF